MKFLTLLLLYLLTLPSCVLGHGHMRSPRTRNYIAHVGGTSAPTETCPHCLNKKRADGFCGQGNGGDYDDWPDFVPWSPQENLVVGQEFNVDVWLDTNHAGAYRPGTRSTFVLLVYIPNVVAAMKYTIHV